MRCPCVFEEEQKPPVPPLSRNERTPYGQCSKYMMQTIAKQAAHEAAYAEPSQRRISSMRRLRMELSVSGCPMLSVARRPSRASRSSGSAAARSPLARNSTPRLLIELSVCGCRLPSASRRTSNASYISGSAASRSPLACSSRPRLLLEVSVCG
eukprot:scaffold24508_cov66-Phaeocystis_antarctica.AAC.4